MIDELKKRKKNDSAIIETRAGRSLLLGRKRATKLLVAQVPHGTAISVFDAPQTRSLSLSDEANGRCSVRTYLGLLVPGVVITPVGAFSSPAAIAIRIRAQNASSMSK
jgi:hypothetical protein